MLRTARSSCALAVALVTACAHAPPVESVVIVPRPPSATIAIEPAPVSVERRSASQTAQLAYQTHRPTQLPLVLGGLVGLAGSSAVVFAGVDHSVWTGEDEGWGIAVAGLAFGVFSLAVITAGLLAPARPDPTAYTVRATAPGYSDQVVELEVPRATDDWIELDLASTSSSARSEVGP